VKKKRIVGLILEIRYERRKRGQKALYWRLDMREEEEDCRPNTGDQI
jgi:hypothetical protein